GRIVDGDQPVAGLDAGGLSPAARGDFDHVDAGGVDAQPRGGGSVGDLIDLHAQRRAHDRAVLDELLGDLHARVDGDGEPDALRFGVAALGVDDADELAVGVEQPAARVARADGRAGLQQRHVVVLNGDFTVERADDAVGDGVGQRAQRVAHGHDGLADGQRVAVADDGRRQAGGLDLDDRHVGGGVLPDDGGVVGVAVVQLDLDAGGPVDDVGAGQDISVLTDDDAGARAALHVVAAE